MPIFITIYARKSLLSTHIVVVNRGWTRVLLLLVLPSIVHNRVARVRGISWQARIPRLHIADSLVKLTGSSWVRRTSPCASFCVLDLNIKLTSLAWHEMETWVRLALSHLRCLRIWVTLLLLSVSPTFEEATTIIPIVEKCGCWCQHLSGHAIY